MIIITVSFVTLSVNWYNNRFLPLIRQFFLIPNGINEISAGFTSYIIHISPFHLDPVTTAILLASFGLIIWGILHQTMAHAS
jgi:hypothetical protein